MSESNTRADTKRSQCAECGAWGPENEYHPFAYCVLVKAIGEEAARANIDAVVEYGRKSALTALEASGRAVVPVELVETLDEHIGTLLRIFETSPVQSEADAERVLQIATAFGERCLAAALPPRSE